MENSNIESSTQTTLNKGGVSGSLFCFMYNSCIYESGHSLISIHYTIEGAELALNEHKKQKLYDFNEYQQDDLPFNISFGENESWLITEMVVLP